MIEDRHDDRGRAVATATAIEVFADVVCPFAHVGLRAVVGRRRALGREDVPLRIRAWPLELVNGSPLDPRATAAHIADLRAQVAPGLFVAYDPAHFPATSLPALSLAAAAYALGDATGEAVSLALRDALFERGLDISAPGVLAHVAARFGVQEWGRVDDVIAEWHDGQARGVRGSPHFFCGREEAFCPGLSISAGGPGHVLVARRTDVLDAFLQHCFGT